MSQLVLTLAVDHATPGKAIGIKEAIAMDPGKIRRRPGAPGGCAGAGAVEYGRH